MTNERPQYYLMIDVLPSGKKQGFPRPLPSRALMGTGEEIDLDPEFDLHEWVARYGYPATDLEMYRLWLETIH